MLLIMREWFCLNALWKAKNSYEKKKYDEAFYNFFFKDKVTELCLCSLLCPFIIIWKENEVFSSKGS